MLKKNIYTAILLLASIFPFVNPSIAQPAGFEGLRISEIMYNPLSSGALQGDSLEYIELKNVGNTSINLEGTAFTNGIAFVFASGASLAPGEFLVLASNEVEFTSLYGFSLFGDYSGRLNNAGERLTFMDQSGANAILILNMMIVIRGHWDLMGPVLRWYPQVKMQDLICQILKTGEAASLGDPFQQMSRLGWIYLKSR